MRGINLQRWLIGGLAAGVVIWILEGIAGMFYMEDMQASLDAIGISMDMSTEVFVLSILVSLLVGLVSIYFYAASRTRFGAGPRTAVVVAVMLFLGGYLPSLIGYHMFGLFPDRLLALWSLTGLIEMIIATLVGAWIYRED
jgi:hypothetical protein